jgi:hypothetical protein
VRRKVEWRRASGPRSLLPDEGEVDFELDRLLHAEDDGDARLLHTEVLECYLSDGGADQPVAFDPGGDVLGDRARDSVDGEITGELEGELIILR